MLSLRRLVIGGLAAGILGAVLGCVVSILQMSTHIPLNKFDQSAVIPFQNFAIYMGIGVGIFVGILGLMLFLILVRRYQYPASTRLGTWLGFACGALLCLSTELILNVFAETFQYLPSEIGVLVVNSLITTLSGGVIGMVAGYLMAEKGARNLR